METIWKASANLGKKQRKDHNSHDEIDKKKSINSYLKFN
jgi:hypothetical protein